MKMNILIHIFDHYLHCICSRIRSITGNVINVAAATVETIFDGLRRSSWKADESFDWVWSEFVYCHIIMSIIRNNSCCHNVSAGEICFSLCKVSTKMLYLCHRKTLKKCVTIWWDPDRTIGYISVWCMSYLTIRLHYGLSKMDSSWLLGFGSG